MLPPKPLARRELPHVFEGGTILVRELLGSGALVLSAPAAAQAASLTSNGVELAVADEDASIVSIDGGDLATRKVLQG